MTKETQKQDRPLDPLVVWLGLLSLTLKQSEERQAGQNVESYVLVALTEMVRAVTDHPSSLQESEKQELARIHGLFLVAGISPSVQFFASNPPGPVQ